jgi:hypothetical protein
VAAILSSIASKIVTTDTATVGSSVAMQNARVPDQVVTTDTATVDRMAVEDR